MPTIENDDDVYAVLTRGLSYGMTPNTALRALLRLPQDVPAPAAPQAASLNLSWHRRGKLAPLLDAGLLHDGDVVTWHRRQLGGTHTATVTADGHLRTSDGRQHMTPGMCATTLAGYPCKGWKEWRTSDGLTLQQLRTRIPNPETRSGDAAPSDTGTAAGER